jgi:hypothetical protein
MSLWYEAVGWAWIALGAYITWRDGRPLLSRTARRDDHKTRRARNRRRKAWLDLRFSLLLVVIGVGWVTNWHKHWLYLWLISASIVTFVSWDLSAWLRSRRRRKSGDAATPTP